MGHASPIQRHRVVTFYLLAFGFSWSGWVPQALYARGLFPFDSPLFSLLGGLGPTLAAVAVVLALRESGGLRALFRPLFRWRASPWQWVLVLGFWPLVAAIALAIGAVTGQASPDVAWFSWGSLLPVFGAMLLAGAWEEIGWRGYALPRLQTTCPDWQLVLIMGVLWFLWHVPLMLNPASPMAALPWPGQLLFYLSLTVIYTWLYQNTAHSLFFVSVFHAMSNMLAYVLLALGVFVSSYGLVVGVTAIVALIILGVYGPQRFGGGAGPRPSVMRDML
ncbi:MAG: type II CAAX endopeptidase family protein [Oscillochloridaceae bacterium]|nr:CPBP family intramembrane metalloprotease [Chloroflexaceae bacterium]MDW8389785.1 type II CAAX endopeptidase family protein [Oscillochloridaceae bacterium]